MLQSKCKIQSFDIMSSHFFKYRMIISNTIIIYYFYYHYNTNYFENEK